MAKLEAEAGKSFAQWARIARRTRLCALPELRTFQRREHGHGRSGAFESL